MAPSNRENDCHDAKLESSNSATDRTKTNIVGTDNKPSPSDQTQQHELAVEPSRTNEDNYDDGWRQALGQPMESLSTFVNEHLVAVRYGIAASVVLLTAYGISHTPLFFRYNTVRDIPQSFFHQRRTISCRLIRVVEDSDAAAAAGPDSSSEAPIILMVRHLSPGGRLLNRSAFDFLMKSSPSAAIGNALEENTQELLKVEVAGVQQPPHYWVPGQAEKPGEWLRRLSELRTPLSCQLLLRRARLETAEPKLKKRALAEFDDSSMNSGDQTAVCRITYRPGRQFFRSDLAESIVRNGRGCVASGLYVPREGWSVMDKSELVEDLRKDVKYLERLEQAEFQAAKKFNGMWSDPLVRKSRQDIVKEVEFETNATIVQKLWRWLRGSY